MDSLNLGPLRVDALDKGSFVSAVTDKISGNRASQIITLNSLMFNQALSDSELKRVINGAALVCADSWGIVSAARFLTGRRIKRLPGIDMIGEICEKCAENKWPVYLLGAEKGTAEKAAAALRGAHKGLVIAGTDHGYFGKDDETDLIENISRSGAKALFVALASAFQEKWISSNLEKLGVPVVMGVGGSFDVLSGKLKRSPLIMRRAGAEWLFRLLQEPSRVTRMISLPAFVWNIAAIKFGRN